MADAYYDRTPSGGGPPAVPGGRPQHFAPDTSSIDNLLAEGRMQAQRTLEAYKAKYLENRSKIMPFFQKLADRALGERDPITGKPINPDGPTKLEQTKGYIRKLVNNEMETGFFLNQMQHILRQEIPHTLHQKLELLMNQVRTSKHDYEMAKQKYQPITTPQDQQPLLTPPVPQQPAAAAAAAVYGQQQYGQQQQQQQQQHAAQYNTGAATSAAIGYQGAVAAHTPGQPQSTGARQPGMAGTEQPSSGPQATEGGGGGANGAPVDPNTVDAIIVSFMGPSLSMLADVSPFLEAVKTQVSIRFQKQGANAANMVTSVLPSVSIQIRVAADPTDPAAWAGKVAYAACLDVYQSPITVVTGNATYISSGAASETRLGSTADGAKKGVAKQQQKRKRPSDGIGAEAGGAAKRPYQSFAGLIGQTPQSGYSGTSTYDRMRLQQLPSAGPRHAGFPPPSKELLETKMLLNVVPLDIRLHRKVAVMLGGPDERYDPKTKPRIGKGAHEAVSTAVEVYMRNMLERVHKIHTHRLNSSWHEMAEPLDHPKKQLELHALWAKRVEEKEKQDVIDRLKKLAKAEGGTGAKSTELQKLLEKEKTENNKTSAAEEARQMFEFGAKKKKRLVLEPPLKPANAKLKALKKRKKGERPGTAAIIYIKQEPGTEKQSAALRLARPKKKTAPINMRDLTAHLEVDCHHSKSSRLYRTLSTKNGR